MLDQSLVNELLKPLKTLNSEFLNQIKKQSGCDNFVYKGQLYVKNREPIKNLPKKFKPQMEHYLNENKNIDNYHILLLNHYRHCQNYTQYYLKTPSYFHYIVDDVLKICTDEVIVTEQLPADIEEIFKKIYLIGNL